MIRGAAAPVVTEQAPAALHFTNVANGSRPITARETYPHGPIAVMILRRGLNRDIPSLAAQANL